MKSVSGNIFVTVIVIAIVAVGAAFAAGMFTFKKMHECVVDKTTGRATCAK